MLLKTMMNQKWISVENLNEDCELYGSESEYKRHAFFVLIDLVTTQVWKWFDLINTWLLHSVTLSKHKINKSDISCAIVLSRPNIQNFSQKPWKRTWRQLIYNACIRLWWGFNITSSLKKKLWDVHQADDILSNVYTLHCDYFINIQSRTTAASVERYFCKRKLIETSWRTRWHSKVWMTQLSF